jgi:NAD(P)-dependent dehydrogenase (short-subunit alcohol dehydrogenase family)
MQQFDLTGRGALVTGSTQGIGQAIAQSLEQCGARVVYHGLDAPPESNASCLKIDLMQPDSPQKLIEAAFAALPELDILVCNAGGFFDVPFLEMDAARWEKTFALNVRAPYFLVQCFARQLVQEKRSGAIILMSSTNGLQAEVNSTAYDSSKGAVVMMARTLAVELAPYNIRVNCLAPGLIRTPLTARWLDTEHDKRAHYERNVPLGRIGLPQDCGGVAAFLASDAAAYITGQVLVVDGGLTVSQIGPL